MPTQWHEPTPEYIRRMADDGEGGLAPLSEVEQAIADSFTELGQVVTDTGDLPVSATIRPSGAFSDAESAKEYLDRGGLLVVDDDGNTKPIGFVWFLQEWDPTLEQYIWNVYIDQNTD